MSEGACPFCATALTEAFRASQPAQPPGVRLTRAALFAFGAGTLAVVAGACSDGGMQTAFYGSAPIDTVDAGGDGGVQQGEPIYGGPPVEVDAGSDARADGPTSDGASDVDSAYGAGDAASDGAHE